MRKSILVAAAFASLAMVLPTTTATASPSVGVRIDIDTTLDESGGSGPFAASGSAVDDGVFCAAGDSYDVFAAGAGQAQGQNFQVVKVLECADGSGSVALKLQVRIDRKGNNYSWIIVGGDGDYARLRGSGQGSGEFTSQTTIEDVVIGGMHVD